MLFWNGLATRRHQSNTLVEQLFDSKTHRAFLRDCGDRWSERTSHFNLQAPSLKDQGRVVVLREQWAASSLSLRSQPPASCLSFAHVTLLGEVPPQVLVLAVDNLASLARKRRANACGQLEA